MLIFLSLMLWGQDAIYPGLIELKTGTHKIYTPPDTTNKAIVSGKFGFKGEDFSKFTSDTTEFKFCSDRNEKNHSRQISFYFDWSTIPRIERIVEKDYNWFRPIVFNLSDTVHGYFNIFLTCKSKQGDWYEVIVNEKTQEILWIESSKQVKFIEWENLAKKDYWLTVHLKKTPTNKIYDKADTKANEIIYNGIDCFRITDVKGQWMEISNKDTELCGTYDTDIVDNVWVRFKTDRKLLIDLKKYWR